MGKVSQDDLDKAIESQKKEQRKGTHIADGVMWCPSCGGLPINPGSGGTCRDCDDSLPMTTQEFIALDKANRARAAKYSAYLEDQKKIAEELEEEYDPEYVYERENGVGVENPEKDDDDEEEEE